MRASYYIRTIFMLFVLVSIFTPLDIAAQEMPDIDEAVDELAEIRLIMPNTFNHNTHHRRPAKQKKHRLGIGAFSDFYSQYIWRGIPASNTFVWQPSFTVEYYGVGFNVWGNFPFASQPNQWQFNEVDFTLYYNREVEKFTFHTWFILDVYPNGNPTSLDDGQTSLEWDLHIDRPVGPIVLFTDFTVRLIDARGAVYWDMGVGYQKHLPLNFAINTSAMFALANGVFTAANVAPVGTVPYQFEWTLAFPWTPLNGWSFTPKMAVSTLLTSGLRAGSIDPTIVWGGLSVGYSWGSLR